jgi:predicted transcriptional regulator
MFRSSHRISQEHRRLTIGGSAYAERVHRKRDGAYEGTAAGAILLRSCTDFLDVAEIVDSASGFLTLLSEIDTEFTVDTLTDATIVESTPRNPHAPLHHYTSRIDAHPVDSFRGISPVISPVLDDAHAFLLEDGTESELITDGAVLGISRQMGPNELGETIGSDVLTLYVAPEPIRFGLSILDDRVFVGAYDNGQFAACFESDNPNLYAEIIDLFEAYKEKSNVIDSVPSVD